MTTTIRINTEIKKQLKIRSAETGISQLELANQYILEGLQKNIEHNNSHDYTEKLTEISKLLKHDNPKGNNLHQFANLIENPYVIDEVKEKKESYRGVKLWYSLILVIL